MKVADILLLPSRRIAVKGQSNSMSLRATSIHPRRYAGDLLGYSRRILEPLCILFLFYPNFIFVLHVTVEYLHQYLSVYINNGYAHNF